VREWYQRGHGVNITAGLQTSFWHDSWLGNYPLKISFPNIFKISSNLDLEVAKALVNGQWHIEFRRQLNENLSGEWDSLLDLLSEVELFEGRDEVFWSLERSKKYSLRSL
jgi:hypothetical protein